jgi:predicted dehydrogenase
VAGSERATVGDQDGAPVRFGIVGSGFMAHTYAQTLARHTTGTSLVAIGGGRRAPGLAAEYGTVAAPDVDALVSRPDLDAVIIATPHSLHLPHTLAAAAAGKHVYIEKPMARDIDECDQMIEACRKAGVLLTVNKVTRFRASPRAAKRLLDSGAIGRLRMIRVTSSVSGYLPEEQGWVHDPAEGGAWLDMGAHLCDALRWFTGSEAAMVFGRIRDFSGPPDLARSAMVQVDMANGVLAQLWVSFEVPPPGLGSQSQWILVGSDGIIDADAYGQVRLGTAAGWAVHYEMPAFDLNADVYSPVRLAAFAEQVQDFADAIRDDRPPAVSPAEARAAIELVEAARLSDRTGAAVNLPLVTSARGNA